MLCVHLLVWTYIFIVLGCMPWNSIATSCGNPVFNILKKCQLFFQSGCFMCPTTNIWGFKIFYILTDTCHCLPLNMYYLILIISQLHYFLLKSFGVFCPPFPVKLLCCQGTLQNKHNFNEIIYIVFIIHLTLTISQCFTSLSRDLVIMLLSFTKYFNMTFKITNYH